jgi:broad specificity phosphatase PhoE
MAALKLLLVRHGQSQGNGEGRMEGWYSTDLTDLGQQQAQRLGQYLAATRWPPTQIYCSPLLRATATLEAMVSGFVGASSDSEPADLLTQLATATVLREELKENNQGIFNGLTWAEACDRYPDLCHQLETSLDWQPIPQAETLEEGQQRAAQFVDHLLSQHRNGDRVWIISHHWILQQMIARLMGCDRTWGLPIGHTAWFEFWLDLSRWPSAHPHHRLNSELWQIKHFNSGAHLEPTAPRLKNST